MPITAADFAANPAVPIPTEPAGYDPARAHLFAGLTPRYATRVVRANFVTMRDGVRLSTDFYVPIGAELPLPVILTRTPYGKAQSWTAMPTLLAEQGFVYAVQDVRGRNESEGKFIACSAADREDGYDTVEWLAAQPWCNGRVGAMGSSYTGETAAKLAATRHPAHCCNIIMFDGSYGGGHSQNGAYLQGGVTLLRMMFQWFRDYVPKVSYGPPPHTDREMWFAQPWARAYTTQPVAQPPVDLDQHLRTLPVFDLLDRTGAAPSEFADMMRRSADPADPYWRAQGFLNDKDRFDTPSIFVTGPLERGGSGFDDFRLFRANAVRQAARDHQYLWFTPAAHSRYDQCFEHTRLGARDFGDTRFPYYRRFVDWFGHWLRDDRVDLAEWEPVRYYLTNDNRWRTAKTWPPQDVAERRLYLAADDSLLLDGPHDTLAADSYVYDPADPTPSEPAGTEIDILGGGYADRRAIEARADVRVYTTAPLAERIEVAGPIKLLLHVSSSASDTDFAAVLSDVQPDGRSINVTHGIARMRYREGVNRPTMMEPGEIYPVELDLWHAAIAFPPGHRIRIAVSSSHFPYYDRNLNTGGDNFTDTHWAAANNVIHHGRATPSALILPSRPS